MSRNIRGDESALENVLSLVEALLQLSVEQDCESKLPLCVVWNADKLRITGYKSQQTRGNRSKTTEVGTKKEYLLNQIKDAGKTLKLPPQKAEPNVSQEKRELDELQTALDWLKELGVREDQKSTKSQGYWKFTLTLKHQTATIKENLEVVKQKWNQHQKTNSKETSQVETTDNSLDWQEICGAMLEKHKRLTTNKLLFADDEMKFELEAVHVPLALVERNKPNKCSEDISAEQGSQLYEPSYEEKQRFEHEAFLEQIIGDGVGKTQGHRIALIGEPGAGKTTQLQTIAFWILDNNLGLPIWISLADLQGKSVEDYLLQNWLKKALKLRDVQEEHKNALEKLFKNKNNRVWLLLDAADEMSSLQPLTEISQQLEGWIEDARVVLTCRVNVWEANAGVLENFETYRLLNFEYPQQVQEFIGRWFHNKDAEKGERLSQELDKAERQRIQDLVKNPLRLALLCSTWQGSDQGLPETRAELYQHFVEEVYKWKENRFPTTEQQQEELNAALGRLAKRAIDQETSRFRLRHKFVREELGDAKQQNSLFWLALKLGWLNEVGLAAESATKEKVYAFYHTTFEEYFAALAVDDWHEFLNHVPDNPALGVYRIFAPQWKEVILLWLGREYVREEEKKKEEEKEEFIQALVKFDDGCGEYRAIDRVRKGFYEFRAYFLATAGIDEWKNSCNADAIVAEIVKWRFGEFKVEQNKRVEFLTPIAEGAKTALPQTNRIKAIAALVDLIGNPQLNYHTRRLAASSLGQIDPGNQKAIAALVELIGNPQLDNSTQRQAASSLERIDPGNQKAIDALVELIGKPRLDNSTRRLAASSLGKIGFGNQKAIDALVELIGKPRLDNSTRRLAVESLGEIGSGNQKAIDALVELIGNPQLYDDTRRLAVESLGEIGSGNQKAIDALVELIGNPQLDNSTRLQAASSLGKIDPGNQKAIAALVELIGKPQLDKYTRREAAYSLREIGSGNQKAIDALVELIGKPRLHYETRRVAALSLGKIDPGNQKAIDALVDLVELIGKLQLYDNTRWQVASSLEKIGSGSQKAIDAFVELIGNPQLYDDARWQVASSLGEIGSGNQKAIDALVELIGNPQLYDDTRRLAVESLGEIGSGNQKVIDALVELIGKPRLDNSTRRLAVESLEKIDPGNQKVIDALVELIGNPQLDNSTRRLAVESLGEIGTGNQKVIDALVELIGNPQLDNSTRRKAAYNLGKIDPGNQKAIDALVELIGNPQLDNSTRRKAAYNLGKIDPGNQKAIDALVELIGNPQLDNSTRWQAASSLGKIGSGNQKAIDALVELIGKPRLDYDTRWQVASSLEKIGSGSQKAIDALVELIGNPQLDNSTRWQAAYSLGEIGSGNQKAIDALVELIGNPQLDDSTRRLAVESLGEIGSGNQKAIAALVELIGKPQLDDSTRRKATSSLEKIGSGNQKAIAALVELIGNPQLDDSTRWLATSSLGKILSEEQMPSVVTVLKDYLSPETYNNDFKQFNISYEVIWNCAQSMPYPAFYQSWHQQEKVKDRE